MTSTRMLIVFCMALLVGCSTPVSDEATRTGLGPAPPKVFEAVKHPAPSIKIDLSDGPGLAAWFNNEYNDSTTSCAQPGTGTPRGLYFCSGVLLRTVDNGNFNPWEYSPASEALRGISFSWIRRDVGIENLYHRAGFILLSPEASIANFVPGIAALDETLCVYPFDAWTTRTMNRNHGGCDFEGTGIGGDHPRHWGSCDNKLAYTSAAQWNAHYSSSGQVNYQQCSWNADNAQGWRNMIESRRSFTSPNSWNEVMQTADQTWGPHMRNWLTTFFYDVRKSGGLEDARIFQQKMANTGKRVPILRLDFAAAPTSRFQYVVSDQVTYP